MSSNKKRETKYDKLLRCVVFARDAFRAKGTQTTDEFADFMERMRETCEVYAADGSKSRVATSFMPEFLEMLESQSENYPADANHPMRIAARESLGYFYQVFPDYLQKRTAKRVRIVERNKIRNPEEFYLIQDYIYELEGKRDDDEFLEKLYALVDNAEF